MADTDLALLRARERSKRFIVAGVVGSLYAAGWLLFAWRASRVAETDCTVVFVKEAAACTLQLSHTVALWGAFTLFYRSGLVLDRGRCVYWWGLGRPWFESFRSLDGLTRAEGKREGTGRTTSYWLVLHFGDGAPWRFRRVSLHEAEAEAQRVLGYLDSVRRQP